MSLTLLAARTAAVEALRGQTWAGDLVFDGAGEIADTDANLPRFAITVESGGVQANQASLVLTLALLQRLPAVNAAGEEIGYAWQVPYTAPAMERALDCFATTVMRKLADASSPWAAAFCGLVNNLRVRSGQSNGAAQRILVLDFDVGAAPVDRTSLKPGSPWIAFLTEIDGENHKLAPLFGYMIPGAKPPALDWSVFDIDCGLRLEPLPPAVEARPAKARAQPKKKAKAPAKATVKEPA